MDHSQKFPSRQLLRLGSTRTKIRTSSGQSLAVELRQLPPPWSAWVHLLYHQRTKNLLTTHSPEGRPGPFNE